MDKARFEFIMIKVVLTLALVAIASAELSCEDCSMMGAKASAILTTQEMIDQQVEMIMKPVCDRAPDVEECMEKLPMFYQKVAMSMFNADHGWFDSSNLCGDLCAKKTIVGGPMCGDCVQRMEASLLHMANEDIQQQIVAHFMEVGFCAESEEMEKCMQGLEVVIPTAMTLLAADGNSRVQDFCKKEAGCM